MFRKVLTEEYPEEKRPTEARFHGRHQLNRHPDGLEKCVGCELCAWACPADAILVEGAANDDSEGGTGRFSPGERYGRVYQINYLRCIFCGLCIEACPTRALTMTNFYELADNNRADLIFTKDQLLAPIQEGMLPAPHPMVGGHGGARLLPGQGHPGDRRAGGVEPLAPAPERGARPAPPVTPPTTPSGLGDTGTRSAVADRGRRRRRPDGAVSAPSAWIGGVAMTSTGEAVIFWILGPLMVIAALGPAVRPQGGARRALRRLRHGQPRRALHRPAGRLPRHRPGVRLHRRRDDVLPLRPHARRGRLVRLAHRDDPRAEGRRRSCSASASRRDVLRDRLAHAARARSSSTPSTRTRATSAGSPS